MQYNYDVSNLDCKYMQEIKDIIRNCRSINNTTVTTSRTLLRLAEAAP